MIISINKKDYEVEVTKVTNLFLEIRGIDGKGHGVIHKQTGKGRWNPKGKDGLSITKGSCFWLKSNTINALKKEFKWDLP